MLVATPSRIYECEEDMLRNKPTRQPGQDIRTVPTYTIPEAADYLAIDPWTLLDWYSQHEPLLLPSGWYGPEQSFALLSFQDLEEAYKVYLLRTLHRYSMQYLRRALRDARLETNSKHPLVDHNLIVFNYLALEKPGIRGRERKMVPLGFGKNKSLLIPEVVDTWGRRIVADKQGKTSQIFPWRHAKTDSVSRPVSLDPEVMSGRLVVSGTRIPVRVLKTRNLGGETPEQIAEDYGISPDLVIKALVHFEQKKPRTVHSLS